MASMARVLVEAEVAVEPLIAQRSAVDRDPATSRQVEPRVETLGS
jgi:hypothetical protein